MTRQALFGAGCFWGVQAYFDEVPGVVKTTVGYSGGHTQDPTYEEVCMHTTGHAEVTLVEFEPSKISYKELLKHFFRMHDPTQVNRQGPNVGDNYRSVVFYYDDGQQHQAEAAKAVVEKNVKKPVATEVTKASTFYPAEDYHQKFFQKTGIGACHVPYAPV